MTQKKSDVADGEELVPFARIVEELAMPAYKVRRAMAEAGDRLQVVRSGTSKNYPLAPTVAMLREQLGGVPPDSKGEEWVPFEALAAELGWAPNTVRKYMNNVRRFLRPLAGTKDARKKSYPRRHTVRLLLREHARVQSRRERSRDDAAGYWTALSTLKVAAGRLRQFASDSAAIERDVQQAFKALRQRTPSSLVEIYSVADANLELVDPVCVLVAPLRLIYWKATIPEIPLRGEGQTIEDAVSDLREKLASTYRQLQLDPESKPELWALLKMFIQAREPDRAEPLTFLEEGS